MRPPLYLPNTVTVLRALEVFKSSGEPMALVVDEYGDLEGLVALNDMLEALVGDIDADRQVVRREDGTLLIDGMVGLDELKQVLGISRLPGEDADFHTLGGYLMARLNRVPMVADRVAADSSPLRGRRDGRPQGPPGAGDAGKGQGAAIMSWT